LQSYITMADKIDRTEMNRLIKVKFNGDQKGFDHWRLTIEQGTIVGDPTIFSLLPAMEKGFVLGNPDMYSTPTLEHVASMELDVEKDQMRAILQAAKANPANVTKDQLIFVSQFFYDSLFHILPRTKEIGFGIDTEEKEMDHLTQILEQAKAVPEAVTKDQLIHAGVKFHNLLAEVFRRTKEAGLGNDKYDGRFD
jgi:hypothetical protein